MYVYTHFYTTAIMSATQLKCCAALAGIVYGAECCSDVRIARLEPQCILERVARQVKVNSAARLLIQFEIRLRCHGTPAFSVRLQHTVRRWPTSSTGHGG